MTMFIPFSMQVFCIIFVSYNNVFCEDDKGKRLVLHSETDFVQELSNLRSEFESYKSLATAETKALQTANKQMTLEISMLKNTTASGIKAVYTRWGRNVCPTKAELVYKGFVGGKKYTDIGSGNNNLCLPSDPTWARYDNITNGYRGFIFGTEIHIDQPELLFQTSVHNQDMPCAVCRTNKSSSLMIPARNDCYPGWQLEYKGYLMANDYGHPTSYDYICMDQSPEFLQHGGNEDSEHILYIVEGKCGSLPCPPYVQNRELACVVCSK